MTTNGWLQLGLYMVVLLGLAKPLGTFMAKVYTGEPTWLGRLLGPVERLCYRVMGVSPDDEMDWKQYAWSFLLFSLLSTAGGVPAAPGSGGAAAQPGPHGRGFAYHRLQYRHQFRHQHQLAGVRRRNDDELPVADAGAHRAELRFRGGGDGSADRADPRPVTPLHAHHRQLLG